MGRKSAKRLCCSKIYGKDTFMWLAARYGGYDYGNVTRNLQPCSQYVLGCISSYIHKMVVDMSKTVCFSDYMTKFGCTVAINFYQLPIPSLVHLLYQFCATVEQLKYSLANCPLLIYVFLGIGCVSSTWFRGLDVQ